MTQNERVLDYIKKNGSITQLDAIKDLGIMRLASRISELRSMGHPIVSVSETVKNRFNEDARISRYMMRKGQNNG